MSRMLIIGGRGFIGRHVAGHLAAAGHETVAAGHGEIDLVRDDDTVLQEKLASFQTVINCAGLLRSRPGASLSALHGKGTRRLLDACGAAGVSRLIHVSALGADPAGATAYQRSKGEGEALLRRPDDGIEICILRPSLVIGRGGASTLLLTALAALPLLPRLGSGSAVQPIAVDDLAELVRRLVERTDPLPRSLDAVGPEPITVEAILVALRRWLGLKPAGFFPLPEMVLPVLAFLGEMLTQGPVSREVIALLKQGNTADPGPMIAVLGRAPRPLATALALQPASRSDLWAAWLYPLRPVLRWSLGILWVASGVLSCGLYPLSGSYRLLAEIGLTGQKAEIVLFGAAGLDLILGLALLARLRPVATGALQLLAMAGFTAIATALPAEYWLHPFTPLLKNLPLAAATIVMMALEAA
jgi:uncharacterized protein YbjT (DUF2867 family)